MPVAKIVKAMPHVSRLSLWTMAMATKAQSACSNRATHFIGLTEDWLTMMR